ncbi:MAG TPA: ORF6N domain-containing protein [Tepidisphaeraceae bacterium]|nr:ORF6N domain-containing protein [Tepidisphaeraceae bacterium]
MAQDSVMPPERIEKRILLIRNEKVLLDSDLADMYDVATKALNQAVKRNIERFPADFMFQLTLAEKNQVVTNCDHLAKLKFASKLPYAFTEQGVAMLSSALRSPRAVQVNVQIMRTFVRLRQILASNAALARKLDQLEKKYDQRFKVVFDAIRTLASDSEMEKAERSRKRIGYHSEVASD